MKGFRTIGLRMLPITKVIDATGPFLGTCHAYWTMDTQEPIYSIETAGSGMPLAPCTQWPSRCSI